MDVTSVMKPLKRYGTYLILVNIFRTTLGVSGLQVQVQDNIRDLQAWLEWMQKEFSSLPTRDCEFVVAIWEGIWYQRNQTWNGKPTSSPFQLFL